MPPKAPLSKNAAKGKHAFRAAGFAISTVAGRDAEERKRKEEEAERKRMGGHGVTPEQLQLFLFPPNSEHPDSTGRLELFARYGPSDAQGRLHGGVRGSHTHTDLEIVHMINHETREKLFSLFDRPRATVEVIVDMVMPMAKEQHYSWAHVKDLLKSVTVDSHGHWSFPALQRVVLDEQTIRLKALVKGGERKERGPKIPFQTKPAAILMSAVHKKKMNDQELELLQSKRLARYGTLVADLGDQNLGSAIQANVSLIRPLGNVTDRWDRYCSLRRTGKSSYVEARNEARPRVLDDDCLADKHVGCSSLRATGALTAR